MDKILLLVVIGMVIMSYTCLYFAFVEVLGLIAEIATGVIF